MQRIYSREVYGRFVESVRFDINESDLPEGFEDMDAEAQLEALLLVTDGDWSTDLDEGDDADDWALYSVT